MKKSRTKDEFFLIKLYQLARAEGNEEEAIDCFAIGREIGQNDKGIKVIANQLAQANFVKKGEDNTVYLTSHGLGLVQELLSEF